MVKKSLPAAVYAVGSLHEQMCNDKSPGKYTKQYKLKMLQRRSRGRVRLCNGGESLRASCHSLGSAKTMVNGYGEARVSRTAEDILRELKEEAMRREGIEVETSQQRSVAALGQHPQLDGPTSCRA